MARRRRTPGPGPNIWPGFTDALAGLVVALVFLLVLFFLFEVVLSRQVSGQETVIQTLRGQVERLTELLGESRQRGQTLEERLAEREQAIQELRQRQQATAQALAEARRQATGARANLDVLAAEVAALNRRITRLEQALAEQETATAEARQALAAREATVAAQQSRIEAMAARIRTELLERVEDLARYRSEFFGRLREVFADRPDIKIRGDRFLFQSEILFPSGEADLTAGGREQLRRFVAVYQEVADRIPEGIGMIIQVEGHTDRVPIETARYRSNWELSTARALSVVRFLIDQGLPPARLAAAGYGEYHPLTPGRTAAERRQNRRIELKITQR
ncbi:MAG TPA: OmpA family protein [Gammaproteobacteria bacterium]|nr:OmpA family protein [Gammaproteobacteria bacterium]